MTLDNVLEQLVSAQIIRRLNQKVDTPENQDVTYWFKHALTQETAYNSLLVSQRRRIHRAIAEVIEELYPDQVDENAALLAEHYAQSGDDAKTFEYALMAGDVAVGVYANAEALSAYDRALSAARHSPLTVNSSSLCHLYLRRGRVLEVSSRYADALANYTEMEQLALERGDQSLELEALMARSTLHSIPGSTQEPLLARGLSTQALVLAQELGNRQAEAKIYWNLMLLENWGEGTPHQAIAFGEKSLAIAREFNLREQFAISLHDIAMAYLSDGRTEDAWAALNSSIEMFRQLDNKTSLAEALLRAATMSSMSGSFEQALALSEQGLEISTNIDDLMSQALALYISSHVHWERGEPEQAIDAATRCIGLAERTTIEALATSVRALLAWAFGTLGQVERGLEIIQNALLASRSFQRSPVTPDTLSAMLRAAQIHLEILRGNLERAMAIGAREELVPHPNYVGMLTAAGHMVYIAAGELAYARGEYARAVELMDQLIAVLTQSHIRPYITHALYFKGKALLALGSLECAAKVWNEARVEAEAMGLRAILWQILADLSKLEAGRGHLAYTEELRHAGREAVDFIAQHAPEDLRDSFLNLPDVRAVLA